MANMLFRRKWKITISGNKTIDVSPLRCTFRIEKTAFPIANFSELNIYNIDPGTDSYIGEGSGVSIEAGYYELGTDENGKTAYKESSRYGVIFQGSVAQKIITKEDSIDYVVTLVCLDSDSFLNSNFISFSTGSNQKVSEHIKKICSNSSSTVDVGRISDDISSSALPRGKVYFGDPKLYLRTIAKSNNTDFFIEDGKLNMDKTTYASGNDIEITPKNGLIGTPNQVQGGVTFQCLLDPRIRIKTNVILDNTIIQEAKKQIGVLMTQLDENGRYRAYKISHIGDTRGIDWYTEVMGVSCNDSGLLFLANASQNGF